MRFELQCCAAESCTGCDADCGKASTELEATGHYHSVHPNTPVAILLLLPMQQAKLLSDSDGNAVHLSHVQLPCWFWQCLNRI
jgi:hypothetical protein